METKLNFVLIFCLLCSISSKYVVDVYFESYCHDSRKFITRSFSKLSSLPGWENYLEVNLWAYGNAKQSNVNGVWKFECQHGDRECRGNNIVTCSQSILNLSAFNKFVVCFESNIYDNDNIFDTVYNCLDDKSRSKVIEDCTNDKGAFKGSELQHRVADKTESLNPRHPHVPYFTINGVFDRLHDNLIYGNIRNYLCRLPGVNLPGCSVPDDSFIELSRPRNIRNHLKK